MTSEFKSKFWSNLKITLKFVGIVLVGLIIKITIDEQQEGEIEDPTAPLVLLAFVPTLLIGVFTYTKLKLSSINKFISSLIFAFAISFSILALYFIAVCIGSTEINIRLAKFFTAIIFVCTALLYLQLPWQKDA
ncbi:hypothetical protein [Pseudoalteromonas shioyasakiensis]|uniref:hypothetical protein n=1 Tax=Pseudoalteromonas shioyasakiensis TaxID=1190813 RepID=UPI001C3C77AD|nr:hypothetical protein [Pseudoalteromonas shioyasakiensis]